MDETKITRQHGWLVELGRIKWVRMRSVGVGGLPLLATAGRSNQRPVVVEKGAEEACSLSALKSQPKT